jgi:hypothetical protein
MCRAASHTTDAFAVSTGSLQWLVEHPVQAAFKDHTDRIKENQPQQEQA